MRRLLAMALAIIVGASAGACREQNPDEHVEESSPKSSPVDGAFCKEHGVLEAVCTKCNPALIPVFKSKGDWCEAHGFPESFCPLCHPEREGRPSADIAPSADGPADGTKVRFRTSETARLAGLRFAKAAEHPVSRDVIATARVVYDAARVAQVNPRMAGVVRAIHADVGVTVRAGSPLAVIESAGVGAEQSRLQSARMRLDVADANYKRLDILRAEGLSSERELLVAQREREDSRAEVRAAQGSLGMVGAVADGTARYTLTSPIPGVVIQRRATIGRFVDGEDIVLEIVDPSAMWVELDVPELELALVAVGQPVTLEFDGLPGRVFAGKLAYIAPAVDTRTRTAVARLSMLNPDGVLRANLFGRGRIAVTDPRAAVLVPRSAVQRARSLNLVFVRVAEDTFEARRVIVGLGNGDLVSVAGRVQAGDDVVTEGSFLLKTETLKESIGAGCCGVD